MSGLKIAAAVFGIIGGIASATKLASGLRKTYRKKKNGKSSAAQSVSAKLERRLAWLEERLRLSEAALRG